jgi:pseudaminic acid synthase
MSYIEIDSRKIGLEYPPYIVAEISGNHGGKLEKVFELIDSASNCGANAVKIQSYTPDTMTLNSKRKDFILTEGLWKGYNLYELYKVAHTPFEWHKEIFSYASKKGITLFSTPFDESAFELLEDLNCPAYKIASFENHDLKLIKKVASSNKPLIISTGMADLKTIEESIETAKENGNGQLCILHCVSGYPTLTEEFNLKTIKDLSKRFNVQVGLSDHSKNNLAAYASIAFGAVLIEKHFQISKDENAVDSEFSMEPSDLTELCENSLQIWKAIGKVSYEIKESEKQNLNLKRSIYFTSKIKKNGIITIDNVKRVRPGWGIEPKYFDEIIGKTVKRDVEPGEPVKWSDINE